MEIKNSSPVRDAAHEFLSHAEGFLGQALGKEFDLKEFAEFVETAGASMLGSMYALLRQHEGKEKSEAWLKKVMGTLSGAVRLNGADALVKCEVTIKDMPNRLAKREELHAPSAEVPQAPPAAQLPKCECTLTQEGSCPMCFRSLATYLGSTFRAMMDMSKAAKACEAVCATCKARHGDEAVAKIVPDILRSFSAVEKNAESKAERVTAFVLQLGFSLGVREMPLTQTALKSATEKETQAT